LISGVPMPRAMIGISLFLFLISAVLEGAITVAVIEALEHIQPRLVRQPVWRRSRVVGVVAVAAVLLASVGVLFASQSPDAIQQITHQTVGESSRWFVRSAAGLGGLALIYGACLLFSRVAGRNRSV
jgi:hypothetical protein